MTVICPVLVQQRLAVFVLLPGLFGAVDKHCCCSCQGLLSADALFLFLLVHLLLPACRKP